MHIPIRFQITREWKLSYPNHFALEPKIQNEISNVLDLLFVFVFVHTIYLIAIHVKYNRIIG